METSFRGSKARFASIWAVVTGVVVTMVLSLSGGAAGAANPIPTLPIQAGSSQAACIYVGNPIQPALNDLIALTGIQFSCLSAYLGPSGWTDFQAPWIDLAQYGYTSWVAAAPTTRQVVIATPMIPAKLANAADPTTWEIPCANGQYNTYVATLAANLVKAGLGNSVIRLAWEGNGPWESDFAGTTTTDQQLWAGCFDAEVTAMRGVPGANFLFDWNIAGGYDPIPLANYYPGNAYVDIMGIDFYDQLWRSPATTPTFTQLVTEQGGLNTFLAFAQQQGMPISIPEWALTPVAGDDPAYIQGVESTVENDNVAFETYFDPLIPHSGTINIENAPNSLLQFEQWLDPPAQPSS